MSLLAAHCHWARFACSLNFSSRLIPPGVDANAVHVLGDVMLPVEQKHMCVIRVSVLWCARQFQCNSIWIGWFQSCLASGGR